MGRLGFHNDTEFTLDSLEQGSVIVPEPRNWEDDDKVYELDKDSRGTLMKVNTNLEFTGKGFDYLYTSPLAYGFNPEIGVIKRGKSANKLGEDWRILYQSYLDMTAIEYDLNHKVAKVPFTQGGLYDRIKARYSDTYDLVITKDADGNEIGELPTIIEQVTGREIFRRSVLTVPDGTRQNHTLSGGDEDAATAPLWKIEPNSDSEYLNAPTEGANRIPFGGGNYATGLSGSVLYLRADRDRKFVLNGTLKAKITSPEHGGLYLEEVWYTYDDGDLVYNRKVRLHEIDAENTGNELVYNFVNHTVNVLTDESYTISLYSHTDDGIQFEYNDTEIVWTEDESYPATPAKSLLPFEMIERLLEKITGEKGLLISNVFGRTDLGYTEDGEWAYLATSSGFWARGFDILEVLDPNTGEPNPPKQFTISLKDAIDSFHTEFPLMWGIEKKLGKEYFRVEKYEYSQQDFVGVQLGRTVGSKFYHIPASEATQTILSENLYTKIKMGYEKGGKDYEEVFGLTSPHGNAEYNTSLKTKNGTISYEKLSKIRGDVEGYDLARRKQSANYPDEDTSYDQDLFFRHLKKVGSQYFMRTWQDDFAEAPKNIYSPDTAGNLLLTPFRCLLRHGRIIGTGLGQMPFSTINWISSNCNSEISTKLSGDIDIVENGSVTNQYLGVPFINGFLLKFKGKVYQDMVDQLEGFTEIDGELVPNWYGKYEVLINGQLQYGRLVRVGINKEGNHEIALTNGI